VGQPVVDVHIVSYASKIEEKATFCLENRKEVMRGRVEVLGQWVCMRITNVS
jgi:hypothetical protein